MLTRLHPTLDPRGLPDVPELTLDTRLVAAVQASAGARCHRAAGLLQAYYLQVACHGLDIATGDAGEAAASLARAHLAEAALRRFLFQARCREAGLPAPGPRNDPIDQVRGRRRPAHPSNRGPRGLVA